MKRFVSLLLLIVLWAFLFSMNVFGADKSIGFNYIVENKANSESSKIIPIPKAYEYTGFISHLGEYGALKNPRGMFFDKEENLFIADTGNNRIVKVNKDGLVLAIFNDDGKGNPFSSPEGVFVDSVGAIYVVDTANGRIVHLSKDGNFVEEFVKPKSDLLSSSFTFNPRKMFLNNSGLIFLIQQDSLLTIDANNNFKGYVGETKVGFNFLRTVISFFATKEQREQLGAPIRPSFRSMYLAKDEFIYATTNEDTNQIRKINTIGRNLFPIGIYGEKYFDSNGVQISPNFCDISVSEKGIVTVLDANLGRLYQYDQDGNNLCAFGGGDSVGRSQMVLPNAIETDKNANVYVLDSDTGDIQIYKPTKFITAVHNAVNAYQDGRYDEVTKYSDEILEYDTGYALAHKFKGKAFMKQKQWEKAMYEFKIADDKSDFSKAFEKNRLIFTTTFFPVIVFGAIILFVILIILVIKIKKIACRIRDRAIYG